MFRKPALILFCASCAWIMWLATWQFWSAAHATINSKAVGLFLIVVSGPLLAAGLSFFVLMKRSPPNPIVKFAVQFLVIISHLLAILWSVAGWLYPGKSLLSFFVGAILLIMRIFVGIGNLIFEGLKSPRKLGRKEEVLIVVSVLGPLVALHIWSALNIPMIAWRATAIAGSDPYCIQIPVDRLNDAPATHWSQLAGLRMQSPFAPNEFVVQDWQSAFHDALIVKRNTESEFYIWSPLSQNYFAISEDEAKSAGLFVKCEPKPGFLYTLDAFRAAGASPG